MVIEQMDKTAARELGEATRVALDAVAQKFGVQVKVGGGAYSPHDGTFRPKVEFSVPALAAAAADADAKLLDLPDGSIGKTFTTQGREFRITGINLRARKMPVMAVEVATGRGYKFAARTVKAALAEVAA